MEHLGEFIANHWILWSIFGFILVLIIITEALTQKGKAKALSPQMAVDKINNDNAVVIDIRDPEAYKNGHIIDSVLIKSEDFETAKMNKYKNKLLILVCAKGISSKTAAAKLSAQGFQSLTLEGGIEGWLAAGFPVVKGKN